MNDGYVFHCTPCGHAHSGECPPKPKLDDLVEKVRAQFRDAVMDANTAWKQPIILNPSPVKNAWFISVGSKWMSELQHDPADPWVVGNQKYYYRVSVVNASTVTCIPVDMVSNVASSITQDYPLEFWEDDGDDDGSGVRVRFVPYTP